MIEEKNLVAARDAAFKAMRQAFTTMPPDMLQLILQSVKQEIARRPSQMAEKIIVDLTIAGELQKNAGGEILLDVEATINSLIANGKRWAASFHDPALQAALERLGDLIPAELDDTELRKEFTTLVVALFTKVFRDECDRRVQAVKF